jgi:hypothetical protein
MPLLTVPNGPTPPSGRSITRGTLAIVYRTSYADGITTHPARVNAEWDATNTRWKPEATIDGTLLTVPGGADGFPIPPACHLVEEITLDDGTTLTTRRGPLRIMETASGTWSYATG